MRREHQAIARAAVIPIACRVGVIRYDLLGPRTGILPGADDIQARTRSLCHTVGNGIKTWRASDPSSHRSMSANVMERPGAAVLALGLMESK